MKMQAVASLRISAQNAVHPIALDHTDAQMVAQIAAGDQGSLADAYRLHGATVFAAAYAVTGRRELAEDVVQEVFVRLWNRPERFDANRGALRAFLKIDARGRAIDALRSERARKDREDNEAKLQASDSPPSIEEVVMNNVISAKIREVLSGIRPEERDALALAYFEGHSYREVARILDLPEGTVKSRIRSGLNRLQGLLVAAGVETA